MNTQQPTDDQVRALLAYAKANGRRWKAQLNHEWMSGTASGPLQQVRNSFGPSWLVRFSVTRWKALMALPALPALPAQTYGWTPQDNAEWASRQAARNAAVETHVSNDQPTQLCTDPLCILPADHDELCVEEEEDEDDYDDQTHTKQCDQCKAAMIQGVFCHESGCSNRNKTWVADRGEWFLFLKCRECGCDVEEGEMCGCCPQTGMEEENDDDDQTSVFWHEKHAAANKALLRKVTG